MFSSIRPGSTERVSPEVDVRLIDAHCHFDFPRFDGCREQEWEAARKAGLSGLVIPGVRQADWRRVRGAALAHEGIFYCLGIHPWFVGEHTQEDLSLLERLLRNRPDKCIALGECGLDRLAGDLANQWPWFEAQVTLARELDYPLVIHSVKTHDDIHGALRRLDWHGRAVVHGFSGSYEQAAKLVDLGCSIGVGGVITRPGAHKTRDAVARLPLDALVLETDAPDMAPVGVEPGQNSPVYLGQILEALAALRSLPAEALACSLWRNTMALYRMDPGEVRE